MRTSPKKRRYPPPSDNIITEVRKNLSRGVFLETACALAGVPQKALLYWIEQGRQGEAEFALFTDMIDRENSQLAKNILDFMYEQAFTERNFKAVKFLWDARCKHHEERLQKKIDSIEDALEADTVSAPAALSEEELLEIESRVEAERVH